MGCVYGRACRVTISSFSNFFFFVVVYSFLFLLFFLALQRRSKEEKVEVKKKSKLTELPAMTTTTATGNLTISRRRCESRERLAWVKLVSLQSQTITVTLAASSNERTPEKGSDAGFSVKQFKNNILRLVVFHTSIFSRVWSTCRRTSRYLRCRDVVDSVHWLK
jgi:hypothetical protein